MKLTDYLLERGIDIKPSELEDDIILENDALLEEVVGVWEGHSGAIKQVLKNRINTIALRILNDNGFNSIVYKQAMVEVAGIITDFEKYSGELAHRKKPNEEKNEPEPAVGGEGSL